MPIAALCRHSTRQAGDIRALGRRCQMRASQFASLFVSFRRFWSKRGGFPPDRVLPPTSMKARDARGPHRPFFGLESAECPIWRENVACGAAQTSPRPHHDGVRRALAAGSLHDLAPAA